VLQFLKVPLKYWNTFRVCDVARLFALSHVLRSFFRKNDVIQTGHPRGATRLSLSLSLSLSRFLFLSPCGSFARSFLGSFAPTTRFLSLGKSTYLLACRTDPLLGQRQKQSSMGKRRKHFGKRHLPLYLYPPHCHVTGLVEIH
jgi:hypothetical protein